MFIKLSIGIFLLRLAVQKVYTWTLRISLVIIAVWSIVIFFWNIFQCNPVEKQWDYRITGGSCVDPEQIVSAAYAMSALNILSDWLYVCRIRPDFGHATLNVYRHCFRSPCSGKLKCRIRRK